jgi:GalNAc-alpha-(1->4)-GalNAc-alpha-(1->3)-diNAcBac-PP-undecaprenol alpha-1,4-N-acetyl-D-galactosaminyltransferase
MRITLVISSLGVGGAERVMVTMANYWAEKGWCVNLLTLDDGSKPPFYELHGAICHRALGITGVSKTLYERIANNFRRTRVLRAAIRETSPNIVISFVSETNVLTILSTLGLEVPVIVEEHIDPHEQPIKGAWALLRRWSYPRATRVVVLTERSLRYFSASIQKRTRVIPNPTVMSLAPEIENVSSSKREEKKIISMGRLHPQKGFDTLIQVFAKVVAKHPHWKLEIWGDGPARQSLEGLATKLGVQDRVSLRGITSQPFEKMRCADIFVLSSRYEGFPMVLCEAMACGLPVISFDCASGPREIIRDGIDGVLVPDGDVDALANTMSRLMTDPQERLRLAKRAPEVLDRFGVHRVMAIWEDLIREAVYA